MKRENIKFDMPQIALNLKTINIEADTPLLGMHFHKAVELVRVYEGEITCCIENTEYSLSQNDILLINSGVMHKLICNRCATVTYIQINLEKYSEPSAVYSGYFDKFIKNNNAEKFSILHGENELVSIFNNIKREFEEKRFCYNEYLRAYIYTLVAFMRRNFLSSDVKVLCDASKLAELAPVVQYIDENYHTKLSLAHLGAIIKSDRFRLCRLFKSATHSTLFEYINFVRLLCAEELLIKSQKSISEIAFECGFASIQYFNRVFKESRGYTPGMFRKIFSES
ncbi:MAG: helix-turn-helix domain-containing protein [Clostridia bacterium]|nr:helix-turn-helix domain-containing protein [Clostridia bacterium]